VLVSGLSFRILATLLFHLQFLDGKAFRRIATVERGGRKQQNEEGSAFRARDSFVQETPDRLGGSETNPIERSLDAEQHRML